MANTYVKLPATGGGGTTITNGTITGQPVTWDGDSYEPSTWIGLGTGTLPSIGLIRVVGDGTVDNGAILALRGTGGNTDVLIAYNPSGEELFFGSDTTYNTSGRQIAGIRMYSSSYAYFGRVSVNKLGWDGTECFLQHDNNNQVRCQSNNIRLLTDANVDVTVGGAGIWRISANTGTANTQNRIEDRKMGVVRTTDATVTTAVSISIPADTSCVIEVLATGRVATAGAGAVVGDTFGVVRYAAVKNVAGTTALVGAVTSAHTTNDASMAACAVTIDADDGTDTARARVTGLATDIDWQVSIRKLEN